MYAITALLIESDYNIIREIVNYIRDKYSCQVSSINTNSARVDKVDKICLPGLEISISEMQAICEGNLLMFSHKEFCLLCHLAQHPG